MEFDFREFEMERRMKKIVIVVSIVVIMLVCACGCKNEKKNVPEEQSVSADIWAHNENSFIYVDVPEIGMTERVVLGVDRGYLTQKRAQESVWVLGDEELMRDVYLVVETNDTILFHNLGFARNETYLKICDMDGDGLDEIFVQMRMIESGDGMRPLTQIWKVCNGELLCIFDINEEGSFGNLSFDSGFEAELLNGYKIKVSNRFDKLNKTVDVSEQVYAEYWTGNGLYDAQGKVTVNHDKQDPVVMGFHSCIVDDFDGDGIYEFKGAQGIWFDYKVVYLGTGLTTMKYDQDTQSFQVTDADFVETDFYY